MERLPKSSMPFDSLSLITLSVIAPVGFVTNDQNPVGRMVSKARLVSDKLNIGGE